MCGLLSTPLHFLFPSRAPSQTDSTCVAILRSLSIHNNRGLSRVHTFQVHVSGWCSCLGLCIAFHTYLSEKLVALSNLMCWRLTLHIQPVTGLWASSPVYLLRKATLMTALSSLLPGPSISTWVRESLTPPDSFSKVTFTVGRTSLATLVKKAELPSLTLHVTALLSVFTVLFHST